MFFLCLSFLFSDLIFFIEFFDEFSDLFVFFSSSEIVADISVVDAVEEREEGSGTEFLAFDIELDGKMSTD